MKNQTIKRILFLFFIILSSVYFGACSSEEDDDAMPEITGCHEVTYKGMAYNIRCDQGAISFDITMRPGSDFF